MEDDASILGTRNPPRSMRDLFGVVFATARATGIFLLPSPFVTVFDFETDQPPKRHFEAEQTAYLDGVRGIAATIVFIEHFGLPFYPGMVGDESSKWSFLQLPIIRLFYHGSFAVCVFFVMSGFVLSRKVIRLERQAVERGDASPEAPNWADQVHDAYVSATFRRAPRLFLPSLAVVLLMAGLAFFFDAFAAAAQFPGLPRELYRLKVPRRLPTLGSQLSDCLQFILSQLIYPFTWMFDVARSHDWPPPQMYGFHLWTIPVEFWASEMLFVVLIATSLRRRFVRVAVIILASAYSAWCGRWEPPLFFAGALLADSDVSLQMAMGASTAALQDFGQDVGRYARYRPSSKACLGTILCVAGLWIGSMPDYNAVRTPGFGALASLSRMPNVRIYWQGLGAVLFVWSLRHCRWLRRFFELGALQYLGQISFALYLVHLPIVTGYGWPTARFLLRISGRDLDATGWDREMLITVGGLLTYTGATWVADIFWRAFDAPAVRLSRHLDSLSRPL